MSVAYLQKMENMLHCDEWYFHKKPVMLGITGFSKKCSTHSENFNLGLFM